MGEVLTFAREKKAGAIHLQVQLENVDAIGFYNRYGFEVVGEELFRAGAGEYRVLAIRLRL